MNYLLKSKAAASKTAISLERSRYRRSTMRNTPVANNAVQTSRALTQWKYFRELVGPVVEPSASERDRRPWERDARCSLNTGA